jgi:PAS domain S-box-containing protein
MPFRLRVFQKGLILVGVPLALELLIIGGLSYLLAESEKEKTKEIRYRRGAVVSAHLVALTAEAPLLVVGSIEFNSNRLFKNYQRNLALIEQSTREIDRIRLECPEVKVPFKEDLQKQQAGVLSVAAKFAALKDKNKSLDRVSNLMKMSRELNEATTGTADDLSQLALHGETETAKTAQNQERISRLQNCILAAGAAANLAVGILLAVFYRRDILQRIGTITGNTIALSRGEPLREELTGADEIALVDHSFHAMHEQLLAASARERALFENAIDVICVLDDGNVITRVNPICEKEWGYKPEELSGASLSKLLDEENLAELENSIARARANAEAVLIECKVKTAGGGIKEMLWSAYWSDSEQSLFCTVHDLTEQKQVERAKAQFLDMISSNLNRPLNSISASLKKLIDPEQSKLSDLAVAKLSITSTNMRRLVELVGDLLQLNELESGTITVHRETCSIAETLQRSLQEVQMLAQEKSIELKLDSPAGQWQVDGNRIIQVLVNLMANAIKFSDPGSQVTISAQATADLVEIRVADRGRGIPETEQPAVFERFKQVELSDGKRRAGTGLGLRICKQIIEEHEGEIGVESNSGQGSIFWFRVPVDSVGSEKMKSARQRASVQDADRQGADRPGADRPGTGVEGTGVQNAAALPAAAPEAGLLLPLKPMRTRLGLPGKGVLLVGIPIVCEFVLVAILACVLAQVDRERAFELKERRISNYANAVMISCIDAVVRMGHPYSELEWRKIQEDMDSAHENRDKLNMLAAKDRREMAFARKAEESFAALDHAYDLAKQYVKDGRDIFISFPDRHSTLMPLLKLFHNMDKVIELAESKELESPLKQESLRQFQAGVLTFGLAANIITAFLLATYFSSDINSRLMLLADNAARLARNRELNPLQAGYDEIAKLDQIFHVMAAALLEARKKERAIFDNSRDIICVIDPSGKFLSINPACERIWGYVGDELLQEKTVFDITLADDREETRRTFLTEPEKQTSFEFENRICKRTEGIVYTLWSCSRKKGEPLIYCIAHDMSARRQLELLKQEFLAMVSHDLRSPLTAIVGITQLTATGAFGPVSPEDQQLLQQVNRDCRSLVELTSDLLDLEKLEAGKMKLAIAEIEAADVLDKALSTCPDRSRVKLEYTSELDETVLKADFDRLTQACQSMINFALRRSTGKVRVRLHNKNGWSEMQIFDSAPPLSQEDRRQLFARYGSRAASGAGPDGAVSSLALALARNIVESHGGQIEAIAQEAGNLFILRLPREVSE